MLPFPTHSVSAEPIRRSFSGESDLPSQEASARPLGGTVVLRKSRILLVAIVSAAIWSAFCLSILPLGLPVRLALGGLIVGAAFSFGRRSVLDLARTSVQDLELFSGGEMSILLKDGQRKSAVVAPDTTVTPFLVVLRFRVGEERRLRSLAILPDSSRGDMLRRLRLWLRWGAATGGINDGAA
jgi:hypothetical protein